MERPPFVTGEIYHIYNRGVEKRTVFMNDKDHFRFIHDLFEFNDEAPTINLNFYHEQANLLSKSDFDSSFDNRRRRRKSRRLLVEILCFCLMPNHYHFLLRQKVETGITEFMRKVGTGYTNYFNTKYDRVGPLFQGKFKAVHVANDAHLLYLPHYIHLNPLDLLMPEWRERKIRSVKKARAFLDAYRWSSYLDYTGKKNFPSVIERDFFVDTYGKNNYAQEIKGWLMDMNFAGLEGMMLE